MTSDAVNGSQPASSEPAAVVSGDTGSANHSPPAAVSAETGNATRTRSWPDDALAVARAFREWLSRPRVRLAVVGAILLAIGGLSMTSSVWTLPLVVVGALMVAIAWIGRRLDGRFAVEWGETGTQLEFRAKIKAPQHTRPAAALTASRSAILVPSLESQRAGIIDGEAHTVEIDVSELEALIAAVDAAHGGTRNGGTRNGETRHGEVRNGDARHDESAETSAGFRVARGGASATDR